MGVVSRENLARSACAIVLNDEAVSLHTNAVATCIGYELQMIELCTNVDQQGCGSGSTFNMLIRIRKNFQIKTEKSREIGNNCLLTQT